MILEACVQSLEEAIKAHAAGANQLELCSYLDVDGLTPAIALLQDVKAHFGNQIPIKVMIRCRPGNFHYNSQEISLMQQEAALVASLGFDGLVFGALNIDFLPDLNAVAKIHEAAPDLPICFHKAIDSCPDILESVDQLKTMPFVTEILTSGGKQTAKEGLTMLKAMIDRGKPNITILPAGRITYQNVMEIHADLAVGAYHGRQIVATS